MKYTYIVLACLILFLTACGDKKEENSKVKIELTFKETPNSKEINLMTHDQSSVAIAKIENNKATFEIEAGDPEFYTIFFDQQKQILIIVGKEDVKVTDIDLDAMPICQLSGSKDMDNLQSIDKELRAFHQKNQQMKDLYQTASADGRDDILDSLQQVFEKNNVAFKKNIKGKIKKMMPSIASLYALQFLGRFPDEVAFSEEIIYKLQKQLPNSKPVERVVKAYEYQKQSQQGADQMQEMGLAIGEMAPDFTLNDPEGKSVSLSSFRGKYVLIDFWAAWCGPCRAENPNVIKAYNAYKGDNFDIIGVSLDQKKEAWTKAIDQDGLPWTQVSDLKNFNSPIAEQYRIDAIPMNYLVDPKGKIVAKNLRGAQLHEVLESTLHQKIRNNQ